MEGSVILKVSRLVWLSAMRWWGRIITALVWVRHVAVAPDLPIGQLQPTTRADESARLPLALKLGRRHALPQGRGQKRIYGVCFHH